MEHTLRLTTAEREAVLLALARLSVERPDLCAYLRDVAEKVGSERPQPGGVAFDRFRSRWWKP